MLLEKIKGYESGLIFKLIQLLCWQTFKYYEWIWFVEVLEIGHNFSARN